MALFLGKFAYGVDDKGRVNIPARFREQIAKELDPTLAIFKGTDQCIFVYPMSALEEIRSKFAKDQFTADREARKLQRLMADGGSTGHPDGQGRITLSEEQRQHAGLVKDVVIFGNFNRIEIWNPDRLEEHLGADRGEGIDSLAARHFGEPGGKGTEA